jgi:hypothetical protein
MLSAGAEIILSLGLDYHSFFGSRNTPQAEPLIILLFWLKGFACS